MTVHAVSRETHNLCIAVAGTGTGVGKTHVAVSLVAALAARGERVCGLKPIESGVTAGVPSDADLLARAGTVAVEPAPYRFAEPLSPHLAARRAGVTPSVERAVAWVAGHRAARVTVVETAGGLLSPLGPGATNLDLIGALAPSGVVLVALDRLGVLHEVTAALLALRTLAPALPGAIVVMNAPAEADASTGTNGRELEGLGTVQGVVGFGRGDPGGAEGMAGARVILARMGV